MNKKLYFFAAICFLFLFASCHKETAPAPVEVDKNKLITMLTAKGRYWMYEDVSIQTGDRISSVMTDTSYFYRSACPFLNYRFDSLGVVKEGSGGGLSGPLPLPYTSAVRTLSWYYLENTVNGKWYWDDEKKTVAINGLSSVRMTETSYLDTDFFPTYGTKEEAIAGGKPERIKMVMIQNDPKLGQVKYIYTLRAAWVVRSIGGTTRGGEFEVLY